MRPVDDPIRDKLRRLPPDRLAEELIGLGHRDDDVRDRLGILAEEGEPAALAAALRRRIDRLGSDLDFVSYDRSFALAQDLRFLVGSIRERLLPRDPDLAFELADLFLRSDARVFECVDDSAGAVGDVFRTACTLWLAAAKAASKRDWMALFKEVVATNDYGARDELLPNAAILFSEEELRALVADALAHARRPQPAPGSRDDEAFSAWVSASQLALALRDPRLYEEAILVSGRGMNDVQRMDVARRYLEFGDPETAIARIQEASRPDDVDRLGLLADCYERLGRKEEQARVLRRYFEMTLLKRTFDEILTLTSEEEAPGFVEWARGVALSFRDACAAAVFLFEAGFPDDGERLARERDGDLASAFYSNLQELAKLAQAADRLPVAVLCYRHLIRDILNDARSKAYGHAVRYLSDLEALDHKAPAYGSIGDHADFAAELRARHPRKYGFWSRVGAGNR